MRTAASFETTGQMFSRRENLPEGRFLSFGGWNSTQGPVPPTDDHRSEPSAGSPSHGHTIDDVSPRLSASHSQSAPKNARPVTRDSLSCPCIRTHPLWGPPTGYGSRRAGSPATPHRPGGPMKCNTFLASRPVHSREMPIQQSAARAMRNCVRNFSCSLKTQSRQGTVPSGTGRIINPNGCQVNADYSTKSSHGCPHGCPHATGVPPCALLA